MQFKYLDLRGRGNARICHGLVQWKDPDYVRCISPKFRREAWRVDFTVLMQQETGDPRVQVKEVSGQLLLTGTWLLL